MSEFVVLRLPALEFLARLFLGYVYIKELMHAGAVDCGGDDALVFVAGDVLQTG